MAVNQVAAGAIHSPSQLPVRAFSRKAGAARRSSVRFGRQTRLATDTRGALAGAIGSNMQGVAAIGARISQIHCRPTRAICQTAAIESAAVSQFDKIRRGIRPRLSHNNGASAKIQQTVTRFECSLQSKNIHAIFVAIRESRLLARQPSTGQCRKRLTTLMPRQPTAIALLR